MLIFYCFHIDVFRWYKSWYAILNISWTLCTFISLSILSYYACLSLSSLDKFSSVILFTGSGLKFVCTLGTLTFSHRLEALNWSVRNCIPLRCYCCTLPWNGDPDMVSIKLFDSSNSLQDNGCFQVSDGA